LNKGIIDRRLISRPIHILSQEYEEIVISVPKIMVKKKIILFLVKIKKKRIKTFISGV